MNNIKVTVEYEAPKKDKFMELLAQYEEVKKSADETVSYYKPLAEVGEHKKLELILEQLETIKEYMLKISDIRHSCFEVFAYGESKDYSPKKFIIYYSNNTFYITWGGIAVTFSNYAEQPSSFNGTYMEKYNILGNWDKWGMYEKLEEQCIKMLMNEIHRQKKRAETQKQRFENING